MQVAPQNGQLPRSWYSRPSEPAKSQIFLPTPRPVDSAGLAMPRRRIVATRRSAARAGRSNLPGAAGVKRAAATTTTTTPASRDPDPWEMRSGISTGGNTNSRRRKRNTSQDAVRRGGNSRRACTPRRRRRRAARATLTTMTRSSTRRSCRGGPGDCEILLLPAVRGATAAATGRSRARSHSVGTPRRCGTSSR